MKTVRRFHNIAEAGFAQSLLESLGLDATLADVHAYTLEPPLAPWGIRLQVPDEQLEEALRVLEGHEGFTPLPEDFEPPATEHPETVGAEGQPVTESSRLAAFLRGAFGALGLLILFSSVMIAFRGKGQPSWEAIFVVFILGGWVGLGFRAVRLRSRRVAVPLAE